MTPPRSAALLIAILLTAAKPAPPPLESYPYVELADMALTAPIALAADIVSAQPLKGETAVGVPPGKVRFYIEADVRALIRGDAMLPARISYLVDMPLDSQGKRPKLKGMPVLLLAATTARPGELRLVGPRAQVPRSPANETRLRAILTEAVAPDAPPAITGVARAFHVAGSLPGEGESQIFLRTADGRPISLNVLRRPGEEPRWAVSLSEMVDDSAAPPKPDSLLWYRLACGLPPALPESATGSIAPTDAEQAQADYALVLAGLGPCKRG